MGTSIHRLRRAGVVAFAGILLLVATVSAPAAQADERGAAEFVQRVADDITGLIAGGAVPADELERVLVREFQDKFDLATIRRFTLGPYWRAASAVERDEYRALFAVYVVRKYLRLNAIEYSGERLEVTGARAADDSNTMVQSRFVRPAAAPIEIVWQVREADGGYLVIDSVVEGVSLVRVLREEVTSVVRNNGGEVAKLIDIMHELLGDTG